LYKVRVLFNVKLNNERKGKHMASNIVKRQDGLTAAAYGDIAANVEMLNKAQVEAYLDNLCTDLNAGLDGKVDSVTAKDASVTVTGGKAAVVGVAISAAAGNLLELGDDGLKVIAQAPVEYSIVKLGTASEGASASYQLAKDGTTFGAVIDIPKDMVVSSGTVVTKDVAGAWGEAGTYIELTLANAANDKLYINVGNLIEYVTSGSVAGDKVMISVSADHKVTATISAGAITATELAESVNADIAKGVAAKAAVETLDGEAVKQVKLNGAVLSMADGLVDLGNIATSESLGQVGSRLEALEQVGAQKNVQSDWSATEGDAFIKNKPTLGALAAKDSVAKADLTAELAAELDGKVVKVEGKQLSTEDFTTAEKEKLAGIAAGAEVNVQADWAETDSSKDSYILNKPTLGALAAKDKVALADLADDASQKLAGYDAKFTAVAGVEIPDENAVTLRSLRTAVAALKAAMA
jgi:hypothetical protein